VDRLGRLHARIAAQCNDWLHKLTTELADQHPVIVIEDLQVAAMSASAAGTAAAPGRRVRQKAGLNRAMLDQGWAEFRRQLQYKCAARGGALVAVAPAYTSQRCSCCGHTEAGNRPRRASFVCLACGHAGHAELNAATNILAAGHAVWAERPAACASVRQPRWSRKGSARSRDEAANPPRRPRLFQLWRSRNPWAFRPWQEVNSPRYWPASLPINAPWDVGCMLSSSRAALS
jgi:putative transposase